MRQSKVENGKVVETTTIVKEYPVIIPYSDIIEAAEVYGDEYSEAPWDSCDGLEHEVKTESQLGYNVDLQEMRGHFWGDRRECVVVVDKEQVEKWGVYAYARASGASKQVAREMEALNLRNTIDQLREWHSNGYSNYVVKIDFMDECESCGGIDDEDFARHEMVHEIAGEVVAKLEARGFKILGQPTGKRTKYSYQWEAKHKLNSQSWMDEPKFDYAKNKREMFKT